MEGEGPIKLKFKLGGGGATGRASTSATPSIATTTGSSPGGSSTAMEYSLSNNSADHPDSAAAPGVAPGPGIGGGAQLAMLRVSGDPASYPHPAALPRSSPQSGAPTPPAKAPAKRKSKAKPKPPPAVAGAEAATGPVDPNAVDPNAPPAKPKKKRTPKRAPGEEGPGKHWRKGLKGYVIPTPPPAPVPSPLAIPSAAGGRFPIGAPPRLATAFLPPLALELKTPRPREWNQSLKQLINVAGTRLRFKSWAGSATSLYHNSLFGEPEEDELAADDNDDASSVNLQSHLEPPQNSHLDQNTSVSASSSPAPQHQYQYTQYSQPQQSEYDAEMRRRQEVLLAGNAGTSSSHEGASSEIQSKGMSLESMMQVEQPHHGVFVAKREEDGDRMEVDS